MLQLLNLHNVPQIFQQLVTSDSAILALIHKGAGASSLYMGVRQHWFPLWRWESYWIGGVRNDRGGPNTRGRRWTRNWVGGFWCPSNNISRASRVWNCQRHGEEILSDHWVSLRIETNRSSNLGKQRIANPVNCIWEDAFFYEPGFRLNLGKFCIDFPDYARTVNLTWYRCYKLKSAEKVSSSLPRKSSWSIWGRKLQYWSIFHFEKPRSINLHWLTTLDGRRRRMKRTKKHRSNLKRALLKNG